MLIHLSNHDNVDSVEEEDTNQSTIPIDPNRKLSRRYHVNSNPDYGMFSHVLYVYQQTHKHKYKKIANYTRRRRKSSSIHGRISCTSNGNGSKK